MREDSIDTEGEHMAVKALRRSSGPSSETGHEVDKEAEYREEAEAMGKV